MVREQQAEALAQADLRLVRFCCRETGKSKQDLPGLRMSFLLWMCKRLERKVKILVRAERSVIDPKGVTVSVKGKRKGK